MLSLFCHDKEVVVSVVFLFSRNRPCVSSSVFKGGESGRRTQDNLPGRKNLTSL